MTPQTRHEHRNETAHVPPPSFGGDPPHTPAVSQAASPVATWIRWHVVELACIGTPIVLAVTVWAWIAVLVAPAAVAWAAHELRLSRHRADLKAALTAGKEDPR